MDPVSRERGHGKSAFLPDHEKTGIHHGAYLLPEQWVETLLFV
jgi:hypothetical protein